MFNTTDGRREDVLIEDEIKKSFLDYAMSVIISRALPEVRDGLKPVHRRILFAMRELKNDFNKPYKKSARVVGDVIGKYHPHGDSAVYDALVRMAQDFAMRHMLVDGQGNFGSVDGDAPAAMRYTEVRLHKMAHEFLQDIEKETVDFQENYDGSLSEPSVLPTKVPNLLVNGAAGIAVGMATNIPPHNLGEVCRAVTAVLDNPEVSLNELMSIMPGPDFPTAAFIYGKSGIREAYKTGRGVIRLRARAAIEVHPRTKANAIVVSELPYQVNKARMLERIADLVRDKKIEGIKDIRDESDRDGLRVVFDLKRDAQPQVVLNQLFKFSQMQTSFGVNTVAIVNNRPEVLPLKRILELFIEHRREVILRRTAFDLAKAEARAHILEGLKIALDNLDLVIKLIRESDSPPVAKEQLMGRLSLSQKQAEAILEMRLQRLTGLERDKIVQEYKEVLMEIARLKAILASDDKVKAIIREETTALADSFADKRRTEIIAQTEDIDLEDMIAEEEMVVTITHTGYIKRTALTNFRRQQRGGKGAKGMAPKEADFVEKMFTASTHSYMLVLSTMGRLYWLKVHEVPEAGRTARGKAIVNLVNMQAGEFLATVLPVREFSEGRFLLVATKSGLVKKTDLMAYANPRAGGIIAAKLSDDDGLVAARLTDGDMEVFLATKSGKAVRFHEDKVRAMGRVAAGVKGIAVAHDDEVVAMEVVSGSSTLLTVTEHGFGKRSRTDEYPLHNRGGKGVITIQTTKRNGPVVSTLMVSDDDEVMLISDQAKVIRMRVGEVRVIGRIAQGVKLIDLADGERLSAVARLAEKDEDEKEPDSLPFGVERQEAEDFGGPIDGEEELEFDPDEDEPELEPDEDETGDEPEGDEEE